MFNCCGKVQKPPLANILFERKKYRLFNELKKLDMDMLFQQDFREIYVAVLY